MTVHVRAVIHQEAHPEKPAQKKKKRAAFFKGVHETGYGISWSGLLQNNSHSYEISLM